MAAYTAEELAAIEAAMKEAEPKPPPKAQSPPPAQVSAPPKAAEAPPPNGTPPSKGHRQKRLIKKRRANIVLTEEEVQEIRAGRKKLRKELRAVGIKKKKDFEVTASSMGLYFDKNRFLAFLRWLFTGKGLWALLGLLLFLLLLVLILSLVSQLRGHFTINLSDGLFHEGFVLSETADFRNPTTNLFAVPAEGVPCISITQIPEDVNETDGEHNDTYFAFTYYLRNEGESAVGYNWALSLNSESKHLTKAAWVMLFEDGKMSFYAHPSADGQIEYIPPLSDSTRGYLTIPAMAHLKDPGQLLPIKSTGGLTYSRVKPISYLSDSLVASGTRENMQPQEVHKYTVVIWLEGDDPDCTDALIGGHVGMEMNYRLIEEQEEAKEEKSFLEELWDNLKFWE